MSLSLPMQAGSLDKGWSNLLDWQTLHISNTNHSNPRQQKTREGTDGCFDSRRQGAHRRICALGRHHIRRGFGKEARVQVFVLMRS